MPCEYNLLPAQKQLIEIPHTNDIDIALYQGGFGSGKCLGKGTPILMYDGSIKKVEDIRVGDIIMGDDNTPRNILSITSGHEEMFRVIPKKGGSPFECNRSHILSLINIKKNKIINISIDEYLTKGVKFKQCNLLYRTKALEFKEQKTEIDPYLYGLWLGDGCTTYPTVYTADEEILDYFKNEVNVENCYLKFKTDHLCDKLNVISVVSHDKKTGSNPFRNIINETLSLYGHKRILDRFKINSIESRKKLLAGLIDSDGYSPHQDSSYKIITTKYKDLAEDYSFIAGSLGFRSRVKERNKKGYISYDVSISGDFTDIPIRLERRKSNKYILNKNPLRTGFTIESLGVGKYYGFTIDGNRLFVLGDFTVTHNTFVGSLLGTLLALRYPGIRGLVGAQTYSLVRDTTLKSYFEHLEKMGIDYEYKRTDSVLLFENGSEILFRHLEEPDKIKSLNLGFVEIEEMSDIPEATFLMLLARLRQEMRPEWIENKFRYRLFGHTNPERARGWIYDHFVRNKKDNFRRIIAPTTENIYLPNGFVDTLKKTYSSEYYNINVMGQDIDSTIGLVTKNFNFSKQVIDKKEIDPKLPIHVTCDFNHDPMCWYVFQHHDGDIFFIKEIVEQYATTEHCANILAEVLTNFKECVIILNGDSTGNSKTTKGADYIIIRNELVRCGFDKDKIDIRVLPKNPDIEYRINCWNAMICDAEKKPHIFITKDCKWLLYNIENLEVEEGGSRPKKISSGKLRSDSKAKYLSHPIDAASYPVCLYYPIRDLHLKDFKGELYDPYDGKYEN